MWKYRRIAQEGANGFSLCRFLDNLLYKLEKVLILFQRDFINDYPNLIRLNSIEFFFKID